jgi:hydrogenase maturation protease
MNLARAEQIANAVLYEGYILYPYRPSAVKNRQRWTFGGIYPPAYSATQRGNDAAAMQTECLVEGHTQTRLDVRVRFLHIQDRQVGALDTPLPDLPPGGLPPYRPVAALQVGERQVQTWQEAVEREVVLRELPLADLRARPQEQAFTFAARQEIEALRDPGGPVVGLIRREQRALAGRVTVRAREVAAELFQVGVEIANQTPWQPPIQPAAPLAFGWEREDAVLQALVSTHTLLAVQDGAFVSLLDPPPAYQGAAAACRNVGTWPVLVGDAGEHDLLLSSPIILYDYPQIAPESNGDLFDGTEIDEILTLRILTMTDAEKQEIRQSDPQARTLLDRTEALPAEHLRALHGTLRHLRPGENSL